MGRKPLAHPKRHYPLVSERRMMLLTLTMLARDGKVYKRDLIAWQIGTMKRCGYIREVGKGTGVYEVLKLEL